MAGAGTSRVGSRAVDAIQGSVEDKSAETLHFLQNLRRVVETFDKLEQFLDVLPARMRTEIDEMRRFVEQFDQIKVQMERLANKMKILELAARSGSDEVK